MKKKIIALCLVLALAATAIAGATLAYFTDKDEVENVFTAGDLKIDLWEKTGVTDKDGNTVQNAVEKEQTGTTYSNLMPSYKITKEPVIENLGKNDAYVRVVVTLNQKEQINNAIDNFYEAKDYTDEQIQTIYDNIFDGWGLVYTKDAENGEPNRLWMDDNVHQPTDTGVTLLAIDMAAVVYDSIWQISKNNVFQTATEQASTNGKISTANGEYAYLGAWDQDVYYYDVLGGVNGDEWDSRCFVFYLKIEGKEEDGTTHSYKLFNGLNIPAEFDADQMVMFEDTDADTSLKIGVYADAIQVAGFNDTTDGDGNTTPAWINAINALEEQHPLGWWRS